MPKQQRAQRCTQHRWPRKPSGQQGMLIRSQLGRSNEIGRWPWLTAQSPLLNPSLSQLAPRLPLPNKGSPALPHKEPPGGGGDEGGRPQVTPRRESASRSIQWRECCRQWHQQWSGGDSFPSPCRHTHMPKQQLQHQSTAMPLDQHPSRHTHQHCHTCPNNSSSRLGADPGGCPGGPDPLPPYLQYKLLTSKWLDHSTLTCPTRAPALEHINVLSIQCKQSHAQTRDHRSHIPAHAMQPNEYMHTIDTPVKAQ